MRPSEGTNQLAALVILAASLAGVSACRPATDSDDPVATAQTAQLYPILEEGSWGFMNHDGHLVVGPDFDAAWPFSEGRALVRKDGRYGYIDATGEVVIPLAYNDAWYFSNGLAPVLNDTTWSFIDPQGIVVESDVFGINPGADGADLEMVELDRVRIGSLYGFRNAAGQVVIDPQFEQAWYFVDGLARVRLKGKWGFIDRSGAMVIDPTFDVAWDFDQGLARVKVGDGYGYVNKAGDFVWAPTT